MAKGRVVVSPELVKMKLRGDPLLERAYKLAMSDPEVRALLHMSNVMTVKRLYYNDHGPVHAMIVAGAALELLERLVEAGVEPSTLKHGTASNLSEAKLVVLLASILHDVGNSVHRDNHEFVGALLVIPVLNRLLSRIYGRLDEHVYCIRQEILHAIYSTAYDVQCLSVEAGTVKVGDGLDIAEGRARIPYRMGKTDIHAMSALSIRRVEIGEGVERPISITVYMSDYAGLFQVEHVLLKKVYTSGIGNHIEVYIAVGDKPPTRIYPS